jgi:hypothetical protein
MARDFAANEMKSDFRDGSGELLLVVASPLLVIARATPQVIYESPSLRVITVTRSASWDFCVCRNRKSMRGMSAIAMGFNLGKLKYAPARVSLCVSCYAP